MRVGNLDATHEIASDQLEDLSLEVLISALSKRFELGGGDHLEMKSKIAVLGSLIALNDKM